MRRRFWNWALNHNKKKNNMWTIGNIDNTVVLTREQALEIAKDKEFINTVLGYEQGLEEEEILENFYEDIANGTFMLSFFEDHNEHMDYVGRMFETLKRLKVEGDITFGSLDGDNSGSFWGYRFDGKGDGKYLTGEVKFTVI